VDIDAELPVPTIVLLVYDPRPVDMDVDPETEGFIDEEPAVPVGGETPPDVAEPLRGYAVELVAGQAEADPRRAVAMKMMEECIMIRLIVLRK